MFIFWVFLVRIFPHSDWIQRFTPKISVFTSNSGICGSEKLRIDLSRDLWCNLFPCIKTRPRGTADFVNNGKSLESSHKPMESMMYYGNTVLERPKQLNIGGKRKYCCIPVCTNAQYDKDWQKTTNVCVNFQIKMQSQNCINCGVIKSKHSEELVGKIRLKLQITHMHANFILILLI